MDKNNPLVNSHDIHSPSARAPKKPYSKPSFRFEQVFVTTALSCGKINSTDQNCRGLNNKVS